MVKLENITTINKLTAAINQLNTSIYMFFERKDDISIHTIVGATNEILRTLVKVQEKDISNTMLENNHTKRMSKKEVFTFINAFKNFFKHADKDHDKTINFDPIMNHYHIIDSVILLSRLGHKHTPETLTFLMWFDSKYPELFKWNIDFLNNKPQYLILDSNEFELFKHFIELSYKDKDRDYIDYTYNVNCK
ncbi:hypothetical protein CRV01_07520 [Arcobacter sp. CECT 8983]|uniref:hypothetical protein n=1 Tax=Arcobacter sp. CECT 8983 TaxID=2044508 RepID=UPI00100A72A1|nr:hypothetical protein [Arcobacter sp. CECT 8983]RXJ89714.1 hypothetical protein CRV01_07520 [Arcobacter sp. CECT 8983]